MKKNGDHLNQQIIISAELKDGLTEEEKKLKNRFVSSVSFFASLLLLMFSFFLFQENAAKITWRIELGGSLFFLLIAVLAFMGIAFRLVNRLFILVIQFLLTYLLIDGGFNNNGVYWSLVFPGIAFLLVEKREAIFWIFFYIVFASIISFLYLQLGGALPVPVHRLVILSIIGIVSSLFYFFYVLINEYRRREILAIFDSRERYRMERDASSRLFEAVFTHATQGIWIVDENRATVRVNQAMCRILQRSQEELIGKKIDDFVDDEGKQILREKCFITQEKREGQNYEIDLLGPDHSRILCEFHTAPLPAIDDRNQGSFAFVVDLTEKKKIENEIKNKSRQLEKLNESLEERIKTEIERRREKEQLLIQQSRLAAMGEMIGAIAHQWRQPLSILSLILQNMDDAQEHGELDRKYMQSSVAEATHQIKFMSDTIDDFRSFFKPSRDQVEFDLFSVIRDSLTMVNQQIKSRGIRILFEGDHQVILLRGYPNELKQVILNIINNSRDAIEEKRISSGEESFEGIVRIQLARLDEGYLLSFLDNGGGIREENLGRIFDPYFSTKEEGKGTGIGLYMCKVIIENNMKWKLRARNNGGGACLEILIPGPAVLTQESLSS